MRLLSDEKAATMLEHSLLIALIAVSAILAVTAISTPINVIFCRTATAVGLYDGGNFNADSLNNVIWDSERGCCTNRSSLETCEQLAALGVPGIGCSDCVACLSC